MKWCFPEQPTSLLPGATCQELCFATAWLNKFSLCCLLWWCLLRQQRAFSQRGFGDLGGFGSSHLVQRLGLAFPGVLEALMEPIITHLPVCKVMEVSKTSPSSLLLQKHRQERIFIDREAALYSPHPISLFLLIFILHIGDSVSAWLAICSTRIAYKNSTFLIYYFIFFHFLFYFYAVMVFKFVSSS